MSTESLNTRSQTVIVTGASGMLGEAVWRTGMAEDNFDSFATGRTNRHGISSERFYSLDLEEKNDLESYLHRLNPDIIIHCAALTDGLKCENSSRMALSINAEVPKVIAEYCANNGKKMVQISTEAVYGSSGCHSEKSLCCPNNAYAKSKRRGEKFVLDTCPSALVIRCTPVGCPPSGTGNSLAEWLCAMFERGETVNGFDDVFFSPISRHLLSKQIFQLLCLDVSGALNCGCLGKHSKYEFARGLATTFGYDRDLVVRAKRHENSDFSDGSLDLKRFSEITGELPPDLNSVLIDLKQNS